MAKTSHRKPVTTKTPEKLLSGGFPSFAKNDFDEAVFGQGYEIHLERALNCPCRNKSSNNPLSNCKNCGGVGWVFIDKTLTRSVIQSMNRQEKYKTWSQDGVGTVSVSLRDDNEIAFMDRITILDLQSHYSEVVRPNLTNGRYVARMIYNPIEVEDAFMFQSFDQKLYPLKVGTHFTIEENRIILSSSLTNVSEPSITIRYKHHPQYHIIDITREQVSNRNSLAEQCEPNEPTAKRKIGELPIHAVARRAQYILDSPDLSGESLFDNTSA